MSDLQRPAAAKSATSVPYRGPLRSQSLANPIFGAANGRALHGFRQLPGEPEVDHRIGSTLPVNGRTTDGLEPKALIEPYSRSVLLVYVRRKTGVMPDRLLDQHSTNARAAKVRIDEQGRHVASIEEHEAQRPTGLADREFKRCVWKEGSDFSIDGTAIFRRQEAMCRVDRAPPYIHDTRAIGWS